MKVTKYFNSAFLDKDHLSDSIKAAEKVRDEFTENNKDAIGEIENEMLQIVVAGNGRQLVAAIIILTYFSKINQ